jgi:TonB family protein
MSRTDRFWFLAVFLLFFGAAAQAEDEGSDDSIQGLLERIPEISVPSSESPTPSEDAEPLNRNTYNQLCAEQVMTHFKPPKGIVKKHPRVEFQLLVGVGADGGFSTVSTNQRSGFRSFDAAAMKALNEAGACPLPPPGWSPATDRVILTFTAKSAR